MLGVGFVTVKVADAESPPGAPETVTVYEIRLAEVETVKEPATWPVAEIEHEVPGAKRLGLDGKLASDEHGPASLGLKPEPVIVTAAPTGPEEGFSEIAGAVIVNVAEASS